MTELKEVAMIVLRWMIPAVCGGALTWAVTYIKLRKKRDSALEDGLQCLLRAEIIRNHDKYLDKGYCPIYAKEALKRAYAAYHELHGNDVATQLYHETMALPTEPPKEE